jgi:hypothetical protein
MFQTVLEPGEMNGNSVCGHGGGEQGCVGLACLAGYR